MNRLPYGTTILSAGLLACANVQAQELIPGSFNPWTASGSAAPDKLNVPIGLALTNGNSGSASVGSWELSAAGLTQTKLGTPAVPPLVPEVILTDIGSRALTSVNAGTQSLSFGVDSWVEVGSLDLGALLGAGVGMSWQADLTFSSFQWNSPSYELDFALTAPAGLLSNVLDAVDTLQVSILDGDGILVSSIGGSDLINLLGITLGDPIDNGPLNYVFSSNGTEADGITIRFEASSLVNTALLGIGSNVATFSGVSLTAVPEPGVPMLGAFAVLSLVLRRRRA